MADTQRDTASLLALLADNTSGDISPQDLRDAIASILGGYGGLTASGVVGSMTGIGGTPTKTTFWNGTMPSDGANVVASDSADTITPAIAATYLVGATVTFVGSASTAYTFTVYVNGAATAITGTVAVPATGDRVAITVGGLVTVGAGQAIELRVSTNGTNNVMGTSTSGTFWAKRAS